MLDICHTQFRSFYVYIESIKSSYSINYNVKEVVFFTINKLINIQIHHKYTFCTCFCCILFLQFLKITFLILGRSWLLQNLTHVTSFLNPVFDLSWWYSQIFMLHLMNELRKYSASTAYLRKSYGYTHGRDHWFYCCFDVKPHACRWIPIMEPQSMPC